MNEVTGLVRLTFDVIKSLEMMGHQTTLITTNGVAIESFHYELKEYIAAYPRDLRKDPLIKKSIIIPASIFYKMLLQSMLKKHNYDLVFLTDGFYFSRTFQGVNKVMYVYFPYSLSVRSRRPLSSYEKGIDGEGNVKHLPRKMLARLEKILIYDKSVKAVACYSNFVRNVALRYLGIDAHIIPPPLDTNYFVPLDKENEIDRSKKVILLVTRFHPYKEHELAIYAFKRYMNRNDVELIIAGNISDKNYFEYLGRLAEGRVKLIPNPTDEELKRLYQTASVFWYVHAEHCATTPLESMACGTPAVMLDKPGLNEVIIKGYNGFLAKSLRELAEYTDILLDDEKTLKKIGRNGRELMEKRYSYQAFNNKLKELINKILSSS